MAIQVSPAQRMLLVAAATLALDWDLAAPLQAAEPGELRSDSELFREHALHGIALPWREAELAAPVAGVVDQLLAAEGQFVRLGDPLVKLNGQLAQGELLVAEANRDRARATLRQAQLESELAMYRGEQMREAHRRGAGTDAELREAEVRAKQAVAAHQAVEQELQQVTQSLQLARVRLEQRTLHAPFDGVLLRLRTTVGENAAAGQPIAVLADMTVLRAELQLPLQWYGQLQLGRVYPLQAGAPLDRLVDAELKMIEPRIDAAAGTFRCVFQLDNAESDFPAGFTVRWP